MAPGCNAAAAGPAQRGRWDRVLARGLDVDLHDEDFGSMLERVAGERPQSSARALTELGQEVRDSIRPIREARSSPRKDAVRGFVNEVETGRLREVS